jgi:hypothetical protein
MTEMTYRWHRSASPSFQDGISEDRNDGKDEHEEAEEIMT